MPIPSDDPIVTVPMVTPFDQQDRLDHEAVARNVQRWKRTALSGFIVGTVSGEESTLSEQEKLEVARTVAPLLDGDRFLIGGIDCPSVAETLRRADAFAEAGAEMLRIRFPRERGEVRPYFQQVLRRSPLPVLLMHQCNPERFGLAGAVAAEPEVIGEVTRMDNVFGYVTDHDLRFEARVRWHVPPQCRFWICNGSIVLAGALIGCNGTTTAFANLWPDALKRLLELGMAGKFSEARALQEQVARIDEVMLPYRSRGIKAALDLLGYDGGPPRQPAQPMPADQVERLAAVMRDAKIID